MAPLPPPRVRMLSAAANLTNGDRDAEYGPPYDNLSDCAVLFSAYLTAKYPTVASPALTAEDVAWLNVLQKMARTFHGKVKADTYIDAAAYSAIAGECAQIEAES